MSEFIYLPCFICKVDRINPYKDSHQVYKGKPICDGCIELILHGNFQKKPVASSTVQTRIPPAIDIQLNHSELCNSHQKKQKIYCLFCKTGACWKCVPNHKGHKLKDTLKICQDLLLKLHQLEFSLVFTALSVHSIQEEAMKISNQVAEFYYDLAGSNYLALIRQIPEFINETRPKLNDLNPDFKGLELSESKESIENGRDSLKANPREELMHWTEWNSNTIYFKDLLTGVNTSHNLSLIVPFYSRSISIPHSQLLLCGGREDNNSLGMKSAWIIHLKEDLRVEKIQDMTVGRSNHNLIRYENYVYVIAGRDHRNKKTNRCERLDIKTLTWEAITSTNEIRDTTAGVAIPDQDALYIFGGSVSNNILSNTIEKYIVSLNIWRVIHLKLNHTTSVEGLCVIPGTRAQVLVFAGQDSEGKNQATVSIVDLEKATVEDLPDMKLKFGCVVNECKTFCGKIYAYIFEGYNSRSLLSWDSETRIWDMLS